MISEHLPVIEQNPLFFSEERGALHLGEQLIFIFERFQ